MGRCHNLSSKKKEIFLYFFTSNESFKHMYFKSNYNLHIYCLIVTHVNSILEFLPWTPGQGLPVYEGCLIYHNCIFGIWYLSNSLNIPWLLWHHWKTRMGQISRLFLNNIKVYRQLHYEVFFKCCLFKNNLF